VAKGIYEKIDRPTSKHVQNMLHACEQGILPQDMLDMYDETLRCLSDEMDCVTYVLCPVAVSRLSPFSTFEIMSRLSSFVVTVLVLIVSSVVFRVTVTENRVIRYFTTPVPPTAHPISGAVPLYAALQLTNECGLTLLNELEDWHQKPCGSHQKILEYKAALVAKGIYEKIDRSTSKHLQNMLHACEQGILPQDMRDMYDETLRCLSDEMDCVTYDLCRSFGDDLPWCPNLIGSGSGVPEICDPAVRLQCRFVYYDALLLDLNDALQAAVPLPGDLPRTRGEATSQSLTLGRRLGGN